MTMHWLEMISNSIAQYTEFSELLEKSLDFSQYVNQSDP